MLDSTPPRVPRLRALPACALLCLGALLSIATPCAVAADGPALALRGALDQKIEFHGAMNNDRTGGGAGTMMYPAPGLAGFLAAIATHAIIANGIQDAEKTRRREEADKMLLPHRQALDGYKYVDLMMAAVPLITTSGKMRVVLAVTGAAPDEVLVDSVPLFYMTQDLRAIVMDNALSITMAGRATPYQTVIRVVSPARGAEVTPGFWFDDQASKLRQTSASMFARSIDLAINDMRGVPAVAGVFKTVRYSEGGAECMERAEILGTSCEHLLLRTLRGNLMAVPRPVSDEVDPACAAVVKS